MKIVSPTLSVLSILVGVLVLASAQTAPQREKVAEGQYSEWEDGHPLQGTTQSWSLWRVPDGFELEDHLPPDRAAMMMAAMGNGLGSRMSPELRRDIQDAATLTEIDLRLAKDRSLMALTLRGIKLSEQKPNEIAIAQCDLTDTQIICKGRAGKAHLNRSEQQQLFYSHPFPLLFTSVLLHKELAENQLNPLKLAILEGEDKKLVLTEVSSQITHLGQEQLVIGQYTFQTEKYLLTMEMRGKPGTKTTTNAQTEHRQVTLWTSRQGIVYAMEDSRFAPGLRVNLSRYKKYSDF